MHEYKAKVTKVIDGDTIRCDIDLGFDIVMAKQTIRLYGIDTPESRTKDKEEKYFGNLSKQFLNDHCPKGSYITLRTHLDKKGKFGRILGELIVNKVNLNEQMIEENLAVEYHGQAKMDIEKEHLYNRTLLRTKGFEYS
jgi:micrococcal nuclease|tara:strand:+ start:556 stop:972 length:417 start_codon:yes stop_codon:yes gene_type:complete